MAPCTEMVIIPLKPGSSLDPSSETGAMLADCVKTVLEQPGLERLWYGAELENPGTLRLFADWKDIQNHKDFMAAPYYGPFMGRLQTLMGGAPSLYHVTFGATPAASLLGPGTTTEVYHGEFPADLDAATKTKITDEVRGFLAKVAAAPGGPRGVSMGWTVETEVPSTEHAGKTGQNIVALLAWGSQEEHAKFRETKAFTDNIETLRALPALAGRGMVHVNAQMEQPV